MSLDFCTKSNYTVFFFKVKALTAQATMPPEVRTCKQISRHVNATKTYLPFGGLQEILFCAQISFVFHCS